MFFLLGVGPVLSLQAYFFRISFGVLACTWTDVCMYAHIHLYMYVSSVWVGGWGGGSGCARGRSATVHRILHRNYWQMLLADIVHLFTF